MSVPPLCTIVKAFIIRSLFSNSNSASSKIIIDNFKEGGSGDVGEEILDRFIGDYPHQVTDEIIQTFTPAHLKHLKLSKCENVTTTGLRTTLEKCSKLLSLDLSESNEIVQGWKIDLVDTLSTAGRSLMSICLEGCDCVDDELVKGILTCCPELKHLDLTSCDNITDNVFVLDEKSTGESKCTELQHPFQCKLTSVNLSGCHSITSTAIRHLAALCGSNLTSINFSWARNVDCSALLYLSGFTLSSAVKFAVDADEKMSSVDLKNLLKIEEDLTALLLETQHGTSPRCVTEQSASSISDSSPPQPLSADRLQFSAISCTDPDVIKQEHYHIADSATSRTEPSFDKSKYTVDDSNKMSALVENTSVCTSEDHHRENSQCCENSLTRSSVDVKLLKSPDVLEINSNHILSTDSKVDQVEFSQTICHSVIEQGVPSFDRSKSTQNSLSITSNDPSTSVFYSVGSSNNKFLFQPNFVSRVSRQSDDITSYSNDIHLDEISIDMGGSQVNTNGGPFSTQLRESETLCKTEHKDPCPDTSTMLFVPNITSVEISNDAFHSKIFGRACMKTFVSANRNLEKLSISWRDLDDTTVEFIARHEPNLQHLSLIDCESVTNKGIISIAQYCRKLTFLDLRGICFVTDEAVVPLVASDNCLLKKLSLAESSVTDFTLRMIGKFCNEKMTGLDLSWCEEVTDDGLSSIAKACTSLQQLALRQCCASQTTLLLLATNCHMLTSLNIVGMDNLTDDAIASMAINMPNLVDIDISWNLSLTDTGVCTLFSCCVRLQNAELKGLKYITSKPFVGIISGLEKWKNRQKFLNPKRMHVKKGLVSGEERLGMYRPCSIQVTTMPNGSKIPFRSLTYAPYLRNLNLEFSDKVNDEHLAQIVAVCRGTLAVIDYYGQEVEPKWIFLEEEYEC